MQPNPYPTASQASAPGDVNQTKTITVSAPPAAPIAVGGGLGATAATPAVESSASPASLPFPREISGRVMCDLESKPSPGTSKPNGTAPSTAGKLHAMNLTETTQTITPALFQTMMFELARAKLGIVVSIAAARTITSPSNTQLLRAMAESIAAGTEKLRQVFKTCGLITDENTTFSQLLDDLIRVDQRLNQAESLLPTPEGLSLIELETLTKAMNRVREAFDEAFVIRFPEYRLPMYTLRTKALTVLGRKVFTPAEPPANQFSSPIVRRLNAKGDLRAAVAPAQCAYVHQDRQEILQSLIFLLDLDDRAAWETDLVLALLHQESGPATADSESDPRLKDLVAGLDVFFCLFELRRDWSFRHQREKFDQECFLHLVEPWTYADDWLERISPDAIQMAESFLNAQGVLEIKEVFTRGQRVTCIRLRADLIVQQLKALYPNKYSALENNAN